MRKLRFDSGVIEFIEVFDKHAPVFMNRECDLIDCHRCQLKKMCDEYGSDHYAFWRSIKSVTDVTEENERKEDAEYGWKYDTRIPLKITLTKDYKDGDQIEILDGKIVEKPVWTLEKILDCDEIAWGCNMAMGASEYVLLKASPYQGITVIRHSHLTPELLADEDANYADFKFFKRNGDEILPPGG